MVGRAAGGCFGASGALRARHLGRHQAAREQSRCGGGGVARRPAHRAAASHLCACARTATQAHAHRAWHKQTIQGMKASLGGLHQRWRYRRLLLRRRAPPSRPPWPPPWPHPRCAPFRAAAPVAASSCFAAPRPTRCCAGRQCTRAHSSAQLSVLYFVPQTTPTPALYPAPTPPCHASSLSSPLCLTPCSPFPVCPPQP
jgi:hypothetical protein